MILEYVVTEQDKEKTINQIIKEKFDLSNRLFSKLITNKRIFVNNLNIDTRKKVNTNDRIEIDFNYDEDNSNIVAKQMDFDIIYEDETMLIINKQRGIAVHPSIKHYEDSISSGVKYYFGLKGINKKIRPVNRLDLNTSGLIIFAKNEYIQECLIKEMQDKTFTKEYLAIATGIFENKAGIIDAPIARKEGSIIERCIEEKGKNAKTKYEVIKEIGNNSIVKCELLTGRTHQIRVHMSYIGHPLLGDTLYGEKNDLIDGQALHCYKLVFLHPTTHEKVEIVSNLDYEQKFEKLLQKVLTK